MSVQNLERTPGGEPVAEPAPAGHRARRLTGLRPLLLRLHFYAGIFAAPFILVAAVTGLLYTLTPQLDELAYHDQLHVSRVDTTPIPVSEQVSAAQRAVPSELTFKAVIVAEGADETTKVVFADPALTDDRERTVYVDPYTGRVQGNLVTWFDDTPPQTWLDDLHRNLHLGDLGRNYSELAASWLGVLAVSGLVIWVARTRRRRRQLVVPEVSTPGRRRVMSWHATVGLWALVGMLFLAATGLSWSNHAGANFTTVLTALDARTPELNTALPAPDPDDPGTDVSEVAQQQANGAGAPTPDAIDTDRVLGTARAAGLDGPIKVAAPAEPGSAWTAEQVDGVWPIRLDRIAVDPGTGQVSARADWADRPLLSKLTSLGINAHMGILFGWVNQVLLAALALGLICMIFWGYRMWWQRRPTRELSPPGAAQRPSFGAIAMLGVLAIGLGLAMPLFGLSLVAFLVIDAVVVSQVRS